MKKIFLFLIINTLLTPVFSQDLLMSFEKAKEGKLPAGWSEFYNGKGTGTHWAVVKDGNNKVLAQLSANNPNNHFNVAVYDNFSMKNGYIEVALKAVKGHFDQGGGIVWRMQDKNNYYIVRYNPLEDNIVLYKVQNGIRTDLPVLGKGRTYGVKMPADGKKWNKLAVKIEGNTYTVLFNGKEVFKVKDNTFLKEGKTGLWTKADAVTYFDNFKVEKKQ